MTSQEFAEAVNAVITSVQHLCREVLRLNVAVTEALEAEPTPLRRLTMLNKAREGADGRLLLRDWYAQLFGAADDGDDEDLEELDEGDDDSEEDADGKEPTKGRVVELLPEDRFLAFKIVLRDPSQPEGFEPQIQYAILTGCEMASAPKASGGGPLRVKGHMLRRIPRFVQPHLGDGKRIKTSARALGKGGKRVDRRLSFRIAGPVVVQPLYSLDGPSAVSELAAAIKGHWRKYTADVAEEPSE